MLKLEFSSAIFQAFPGWVVLSPWQAACAYSADALTLNAQVENGVGRNELHLASTKR